MGFDVGALLANLFLAYFAQAGHEPTPGARDDYREWILAQAISLWDGFGSRFLELWRSLTAFELLPHGVPHTVVVDNVGGHLMQHGEVDLCIVGTDRTAANGDVCNKVGTYLKALAAHDNGVPFYVGLPSPTIDWTIADGVREIPIEQRDSREVTEITGRNVADGAMATVQITPDGSPAANYAFDVTPARLITGLITERGVCPASREGLSQLFDRPLSPALAAAGERATLRPEKALAAAMN